MQNGHIFDALYFFPLAGSAWYNYENANDCANFCPDLQVSAVSRSLLMSVIVGANFRLAIKLHVCKLCDPLLSLHLTVSKASCIHLAKKHAKYQKKNCLS